MGGEIKVVKKSGSGTLMRLYLVLHTPASTTEENSRVDYVKHDVTVSFDFFSFSSDSTLAYSLCSIHKSI